MKWIFLLTAIVMVSMNEAAGRAFYVDFGSLPSDESDYRNGVTADDVRNAALADSPLTGMSVHTFVLSGVKDSRGSSSNLSFTWRSNTLNRPYDHAYASPIDWVNQNASIGKINGMSAIADGDSELQVDGLDPSKRYTVSLMVNAMSLDLGFWCAALDKDGAISGNLSGSYAFNEQGGSVGSMDAYSGSQVYFDDNQVGWYQLSFDISEADSFAFRVTGSLLREEWEPMPYEIAGMQIVEHEMVPEPAAGVLGLSGMAGLLWRRRRV